MLSNVDRKRKGVADRCPTRGEEDVCPVERLPNEPAVGRRRGCDLSFAGEHDESDAHASRDPLEERADRTLGRRKPRRLDVVRVHRARDVEHEHDRGLVVRDEGLHPRPRHGGAERRERDEKEDERDVAAPRPTADH